MTWRSLRHDRRGGISVLVAGSLFMLAGAASVAVDLGSVYLARRELQGMADAAALAAVDGGRGAVDGLLAQPGFAGVALRTIEQGRYRADRAVPVSDRFVSGDASGGATRVELVRRTPLYFARLLTGRDGVDLSARAVAMKRDVAAFSLTTGLASLSGGVPNMLLSSLAGTQLDLSILDVQGLASLNIDLLGFADALRVRTGRDGDPYGALFDAELPLSEVLKAMADSAGQTPAAETLLGIANRITGRSVRLSDIIDLGPAGKAASPTGQPHFLVDALSMLRMTLSPASGSSVPIDLTVAVPGLTSTRLKIVMGEGQTRSPLMTITDSRDMVLRTGQMRLYLETQVASALAGIASVRVPLYVELAAAEARLSAIGCGGNGTQRGVDLSVTPSIGNAAIADLDPAALARFDRAPDQRPALLAQTLLGVRVTGQATIALGGASAQLVHFTPAEIADQATKRVTTQAATQDLASALAGQTQVQVSALGLSLPLSPLIAPVTTLLASTAPLLDGIINSVTATLGVRLGTADVRVHDLRCGMGSIVA